MTTETRSRAYDPTYQPTKNWQQLAQENPNSPGLKMLADREKSLASPSQSIEAPSVS